jgi:hypothetical protein
VKKVHFTGGLPIAQRLYNYPISDLGAKRSITGITTFLLFNIVIVKINGLSKMHLQVRIQGGGGGGGGGGAPGASNPTIGKNMIFWRKIVIFHTKYPKKFRAFLRSAQFFKVRPPIA